MKAYVLRRPGPPESLKMAEVQDPGQPGPGQVRIRVAHIGLNYAEVLSRKGQYGWAPKRPYVPGMEVQGRIEAVGSGVDAARVGQEVVAGMQFGGYAEVAVVPEYMAFPRLPHLDGPESTALLVNYMTAWVALVEQARVQPGETVLVQAAAGGVGSAAVRMLKAMGCRVVGLAGGAAKVALLEEAGVDLALDYRAGGWPAQVRAAGMRPDAVLELVGGEVFRESLALLRPFGRVAVAGYASIPLRMWNPLTWWPAWRDAPRAGMMDLAKASQGMFYTHIGYMIQDRELVEGAYGRMASFVAEHGIRPVVGRVMPWQQMAEAHRWMEGRGSVGKVVLRVEG